MNSNKRRVATFVRRAPWSIRLAQVIWRRVVQPWVTVGVLGAVFNTDGQLLIVEHVFHPRLPWGLPGGWMNRHEAPDETVIRELREETGLTIFVEKPLLITAGEQVHGHLDIAFLCRAQPGPIHLSAELLDYRWIDPLALPPLMDFQQRVIAAALLERSQESKESLYDR